MWKECYVKSQDFYNIHSCLLRPLRPAVSVWILWPQNICLLNLWEIWCLKLLSFVQKSWLKKQKAEQILHCCVKKRIYSHVHDQGTVFSSENLPGVEYRWFLFSFLHIPSVTRKELFSQANSTTWTQLHEPRWRGVAWSNSQVSLILEQKKKEKVNHQPLSTNKV